MFPSRPSLLKKCCRGYLQGRYRPTRLTLIILLNQQSSSLFEAPGSIEHIAQCTSTPWSVRVLRFAWSVSFQAKVEVCGSTTQWIECVE